MMISPLSMAYKVAGPLMTAKGALELIRRYFVLPLVDKRIKAFKLISINQILFFNFAVCHKCMNE